MQQNSVLDSTEKDTYVSVSVKYFPSMLIDKVFHHKVLKYITYLIEIS